MTIYSIGDLHLSDGQKPMDVFGEHWAGHFDRVRQDWGSKVRAGDVVLLPGDLSWALTLEDAKKNLYEIGLLPGLKIMIRGNHDFWWSSLTQLRRALPAGMIALQNDSYETEDAIFAGSRGWLLPDESLKEDDQRIFRRELLRLEMSLKSARARSSHKRLICMMHYPPLTIKCPDTDFTRLFEQYGASHVAYGHLHGQALDFAFRGEKSGIFYHQVSCDGLDFKLYKVE